MVPSPASYLELQNGSRTIFFLVKGSIDHVWNPRVLYRTQRNPFLRVYRTFLGFQIRSADPFKVLLYIEPLRVRCANRPGWGSFKQIVINVIGVIQLVIKWFLIQPIKVFLSLKSINGVQVKNKRTWDCLEPNESPTNMSQRRATRLFSFSPWPALLSETILI